MVREGAGGVRLGFVDGASARLRRHRRRGKKGREADQGSCLCCISCVPGGSLPSWMMWGLEREMPMGSLLAVSGAEPAAVQAARHEPGAIWVNAVWSITSCTMFGCYPTLCAAFHEGRGEAGKPHFWSLSGCQTLS